MNHTLEPEEIKRAAAGQQFLDQLFGESLGDNRKLTIFTTPDRASRRFTSIEEAAEYATTRPSSSSVYHGLGTVDAPRWRGTADEVLSISALWCDIDVRSDSHPSDKLPRTIDEATSLLAEMPLAPSIIVMSGNGIHGYWLLAEPWIFADESDRAAAKRLAWEWHGLVCQLGEGHGWDLDNLGDLARVLRTPGTINPKGGKLVSILANSGARYERAEFERHLPRPAERPTERSASPAPQYATGHGLDLLDRVRSYLDRIPGAVEGQAGGTQTLLACKALFRFGLDDDTARQLFDFYNAKCSPPWTNERQIAHKLSDAKKSVLAEGSFGRLIEQSQEELDVDLSRILCATSDTSPHDNYKDTTSIITFPLRAEADDFNVDKHPGPMPESVSRPGGIMREIIDFILAGATIPQPSLAVAGAASLVATVCGRKVAELRGLRSNIYFLSVAQTGMGKDRARTANAQILSECGAENLLGPERFASHAGLISALDETPCMLAQIDEFGRFISTTSDGRKNPHLFQFVNVLLEIWGSAGRTWRSDAYSDKSRTKTINCPNLVIHGTTTPGALWSGITRRTIEDGLLSRMIVVEGDEDADFRPTADPPETVPVSIADFVKRWQTIGAELGNLATLNPVAKVVRYSREAADRLDGHQAACLRSGKQEREIRRALWSRNAEKARKLALIHAVSSAAGEVPAEIGLSDAEWGIAFANWSTRLVCHHVEERVSENQHEASVKDVLRFIGQRRGSSATTTEITRNFRGIRTRDLQDILRQLLESGDLRAESVPGRGRPTTRFVRLTG